jgi:hypothetical protein
MKNIKLYTDHLRESEPSPDSAIDDLKERLWVAYFTEGGKHYFTAAYDDATEAGERYTREAGEWNEEEIEEEMGGDIELLPRYDGYSGPADLKKRDPKKYRDLYIDVLDRVNDWQRNGGRWHMYDLLGHAVHDIKDEDLYDFISDMASSNEVPAWAREGLASWMERLKKLKRSRSAFGRF